MMLRDRWDKKGFNVMQSSRDADVLICKKALDLAKEGKSVQLHGKDSS